MITRMVLRPLIALVFLVFFSSILVLAATSQSPKTGGVFSESYCCYNGQPQSAVSTYCKNADRFFNTKQEALSQCAKAAPKTSASSKPVISTTPAITPDGYCCSGGSVKKMSQKECSRQKGTFSTSRTRALKICDSLTGYCCREGTVEKTRLGTCRKQKGSFYVDHAEALKRCGETRGYCCDQGSVTASTRKSCDSAGGLFSISKVGADRHCAQTQGFCCDKGSIKKMSKGVCEKNKAEFYISNTVARKRCSPVPSIPGPSLKNNVSSGLSGFQSGKRLELLPDLMIADAWLDDNCRLQLKLENSGGAIDAKLFLKSRMQLSTGSLDGLTKETMSLPKVDPKGTLKTPNGVVLYNTGIEFSGKQGILALIDNNRIITESDEKNNRYAGNLECPLNPAGKRLHKEIDLPVRDSDSAEKASGAGIEKSIVPGTLASKSVLSKQMKNTRKDGGDTNGLKVMDPLRGDYVTRGDDVRVSWQPWYFSGTGSLCGSTDVAIRLVDTTGFDRLIYTGPETLAPDDECSVVLDRALFMDVPDGDHYSVIVQKGASEGFASGESWEFSIGPIRDGSTELAPGERVVEIVEPSSGITVTAGDTFLVRWRVYPLHIPAVDSFELSLLPASGEARGAYGTGYAAHLGETNYQFDNESRIYSALIRLPCQRSYDGVLTISHAPTIGIDASPDHVQPIHVVGISEYGRGIGVLDPRPGIRKHLGDELTVRWEVDSGLVSCAEADYQTILLCPNGDIDDLSGCRVLREVTGDMREISIPLDEDIDTVPGDYYVRVIFGPGIDVGTSRQFSIIDPLPADRLTMLWPDRATTLIRGQTYTVRWTGMDDAPGSRRVSVELYNRVGLVASLGSESANRGRFEWSVPLCLSAFTGDDFYLKLRISDNERLNTDSPQLSLVAPAFDFRRTSPGPGERWEFGTIRTITWRTNGAFPDDATMNIYLYKGGLDWMTIGVDIPVNDRRFDWEVGRAYTVFSGSPEISGPEMATGYMGGLPDRPGDDYSIYMELGECADINAETNRFILEN